MWKRVFCFILLFNVLFIADLRAQFNTIYTLKSLYKVERVDETNPSSAINTKEYLEELDSKTLKDRLISQYMSVCYPLKGIKVTSSYGKRIDPISKKSRNHSGLDLKANDEEVYSMMAGKVIKTGSDKRSGNYIIIRHGDYTISYCHLSMVLVRASQDVRAGDVVALSGNTGRSTGPHLHITCKFKGKYIDPMVFLNYIDKVKSDAVDGLTCLSS